VVGSVVRAHGVRGDVLVEVRTDVPERRFQPGAQLVARFVDGLTRTVVVDAVQSRVERSRLVVAFREVTDRAGAEALHGSVLLAQPPVHEPPPEPDAYFDHQLVGLAVHAPDGHLIGRVVDVEHPPAQDLLVVQASTGGQTLVPFVRAIVTEVDLPGGRLTVDAPVGLFDDDRRDQDAPLEQGSPAVRDAPGGQTRT
jgi:16S rRNA processing protein RimM